MLNIGGKAICKVSMKDVEMKDVDVVVEEHPSKATAGSLASYTLSELPLFPGLHAIAVARPHQLAC
jgi:hypothetical protein